MVFNIQRVCEWWESQIRVAFWFLVESNGVGWWEEGGRRKTCINMQPPVPRCWGTQIGECATKHDRDWTTSCFERTGEVGKSRPLVITSGVHPGTSFEAFFLLVCFPLLPVIITAVIQLALLQHAQFLAFSCSQAESHFAQHTYSPFLLLLLPLQRRRSK